ncbi:hypothetical protein AHAS_Ahas19G0171600 [Arachis hypogaea]
MKILGGTSCISLQISTLGSYGSEKEFFYKFGPLEAIFSKEDSMTYEYFKNKTSFLDGYKLIYGNMLDNDLRI